jgi:predicted O-linked N-acetylglucosamine transferase (SPINDLY family)
VSGGLLHAAGMAPLVRPDIASYVQTAVSLLNDPAELVKIKQVIRQRKARMPVFDAQMRTRQLEAAYLEVYKRSRHGVPPDHLMVRLKRASAAGNTTKE